MNRLLTLIKREYWENKNSFFRGPVVFSAFLVFIGFCYLVLLCTHVLHPHFGDINALGNIPSSFIKTMFYGIAIPFCIVLWIIVFYYFLGSLYDDRKDKSILFWQSLPIAEWETIASKLLAGIVVAPICMWLCLVVTEFILLIYITIAGAVLHLSPLSTLWSPLTIISSWFHLLGMLFLQMLWLLPIFGWFMLASAYAKKSPFLIAIIPLIILRVIESIFLPFNTHITGYIWSRFSLAFESWWHIIYSADQTSANPAPLYLHTGQYGMMSLYWSMPIALAFMCIAGYLRYKCFRSDD